MNNTNEKNKNNASMNDNVKKNGTEDDTEQKNNNDENNVNLNILNNYSFDINNINSNKRTFDELDILKNNNSINNNYGKSGFKLSDLNCCYSPFTQYKKDDKNKIKENKKSKFNSKKKKLNNALNLDKEEEASEKYEMKNKNDIDLLDNFNFSESNFNITKDEYTFPSSPGEQVKIIDKKKQK